MQIFKRYYWNNVNTTHTHTHTRGHCGKTAHYSEKLIHEEIKRRLNLDNACYHSVQNLSSSRLLSKNVNINIYKTRILPLVLYGCETWSLTLRKEYSLNVLEEDTRKTKARVGNNIKMDLR
jgi:hypothetical protein